MTTNISTTLTPSTIALIITQEKTQYRWIDFNVGYVESSISNLEELEEHLGQTIWPVEHLDYVRRLAGVQTSESQEKNPPIRSDLTHEEFIEFIHDELGISDQADHICAALSSGARGKMKPTELLDYLQSNKKFNYRFGQDPRGGKRVWNFNDIDRRVSIRLLQDFFSICID